MGTLDAAASGGIRPLGARLIVVIAACLGTAGTLWICAALSQGSLGSLRLANMGPEPLPMAMLAFVLTALGGALAVLVEPARQPIPSQVMRTSFAPTHAARTQRLHAVTGATRHGRTRTP